MACIQWNQRSFPHSASSTHWLGVTRRPLSAETTLRRDIAQTHGCRVHSAGTLSSTAFANLYQMSDIVHIATHGFQSSESGWQSSITLQEKFRVLDLAKLRSKAALVVFGACVSGLGHETIGSDIIGFSHAVLGLRGLRIPGRTVECE